MTLKSGIRLLKLRNPWYIIISYYHPYLFIYLFTYLTSFRGSFEWNGDWSDKSELWKKYPNIKFEMQNFTTGIFHIILLTI